MKKIFMTLAAAVIAVSANAQIWVGGEVGFSSDKETTKTNGNSVSETTNNFTLAPEVGYNLNENWAIALKVQFAHNEDNASIKSLIEGFVPGSTGAKVMTNAFTVNPYARYTFLKAGNFSAFVDGGVSYGLIHVSSLSNVMNNVNTLGVGINPGVTYAVSPKVSLVAHIGDLSYNTMWTKAKNADVKFNKGKFNIGIWNAISFGAYYNF